MRRRKEDRLTSLETMLPTQMDDDAIDALIDRGMRSIKGQLIVVSVAERTTQHDTPPENTWRMIRWIDRHSDGFYKILEHFDRVVDDFNKTPDVALPASHANFHILKGVLGDRKLPRVLEMLGNEGTSELRLFIQTMARIDEMMRRGEQPEEFRTEPYLRYHTTQTRARNLVIAAVFHTYEEFVVAREGLRDQFEPDRLVEALMEVASQTHLINNGLFTALSSPRGLNWVDRYPRFTEQFRKNLGFN